jgi:hypothetical protein
MAFDDLDDFLDLDMGAVPVIAGAVTGLGYLDLNSEIIFDDGATVIDYFLTAKTDLFGGLNYGSAITVNGQSFKVKMQPLPFDDGGFCKIPLVKISTVIAPLVSRLLRTGSGQLLVTGSGRSLQTQPS